MHSLLLLAVDISYTIVSHYVLGLAVCLKVRTRFSQKVNALPLSIEAAEIAMT